MRFWNRIRRRRCGRRQGEACSGEEVPLSERSRLTSLPSRHFLTISSYYERRLESHRIRSSNCSRSSQASLTDASLPPPDPGIFTGLLKELGVKGLEVAELYGLEPELLEEL